MRVLKVSQTYYPYLNEGGRPVKVRAVAEHLAGRGHRLTVVTADFGGAHIPSKSQAAVEVHYFRTWARYRTMTLNPGIWGFCWKRLRKFDIVHIYGLYDLLGPTVAAFCWWWDIPYVLEPLGMFRPIVRNVALKHAYRRLLGWPVVRGAARVIATSDLERRELVADGVPSEKVVVRRNGVDLREFEHLPPRGVFRRELGTGDEDLLVLYLGRLSCVKGLDMLLEAFSSLDEPASLALVGPDDGDGCLQGVMRLRNRLGPNSRVHVLGPKIGAERLVAFVDADVFVLPSRSESFGNAAAEAVACGVPVVVTDRCGIAPLVQDRAGLVVPCDGEALRRALHRLAKDHDLRERLRAGTLQVRRDLSWDAPIIQLERLYGDLVRSREPTR